MVDEKHKIVISSKNYRLEIEDFISLLDKLEKVREISRISLNYDSGNTTYSLNNKDDLLSISITERVDFRWFVIDFNDKSSVSIFKNGSSINFCDKAVGDLLRVILSDFLEKRVGISSFVDKCILFSSGITLLLTIIIYIFDASFRMYVGMYNFTLFLTLGWFPLSYFAFFAYGNKETKLVDKKSKFSLLTNLWDLINKPIVSGLLIHVLGIILGKLWK